LITARQQHCDAWKQGGPRTIATAIGATKYRELSPQNSVKNSDAGVSALRQRRRRWQEDGASHREISKIAE
jgi:hypothetical protein